MNTIIKNILSSMDSIDAWHILSKKTSSNEFFYIKQNVDMNRIKDVNHFKVTVYKNFEEDGKKYKGSSTVLLSPTMEEQDIVEALNEAAYASTFVKNEFYPLVENSIHGTIDIESQFSTEPLQNWMPKLTKSLFKHDDKSTNPINSAELFLNKCTTRIQNSHGIDVTYTNYNGNLEFITNWTGKEEVESYRNIDFSDFNTSLIEDEVKSMIEFTKEKTAALPTPNLKNINVLLTGEPVKEFFSYYLAISNAQNVYDHVSQYKINDHVQGDDIKGDKVTIILDPNLKNSTHSVPVDADGFELKKIELMTNGVLNNYWGLSRYTHYLGIEPVGDINNFVVSPGSMTINELKSDPYIELLEFSDFQVNPLTGDFAGEIRLGRYFDGKTLVAVTTGSISGNIKDVHSNVHFSKELYQDNNYLGPKTLKMYGIDIAGN